MKHKNPLCHAFHIIQFAPLIFLLQVPARAGELTKPLTAATIQRTDHESAEQFELRKQRITYGTVENNKHCKGYLSVNVGLCKGGRTSACFTNDLYKNICVKPGEDPDHAVSMLPALEHEKYFDFRDDRWMSRTEYCNWLASMYVSKRGASAHANQYKQNCT